MKRLFPLCVSVILILGIVGCKSNSSTNNVGVDLPDNEWTAITVSPAKTPPLPTYKGNKSALPIDLWRKPGTFSAVPTKNINGTEATIGATITWPDTLVVVYDDNDTISKPTPNFNGEVNFYYKIKNNKWAFDGLTPGKIVSDSAATGEYVKIDSIQIEVLAGTNIGKRQSINSVAQVISAENYPYIFHIGDSIKLNVYKSGSLPDNSTWVLLHVPDADYTGFFASLGSGVYTGTWAPKDTVSRWAWVDVFDTGVLFNKTQMAERDIFWGIPYKVIQ